MDRIVFSYVAMTIRDNRTKSYRIVSNRSDAEERGENSSNYSYVYRSTFEEQSTCNVCLPTTDASIDAAAIIVISNEAS